MRRFNLAKIIDHTNIKAKATARDIKKTCQEAKRYKFRGVCVNPEWVKFVREELKGTGIKTVVLIDPPMGLSPHTKRVEVAKQAKKDGADEIDMVINVGRFLCGDDDYIVSEIKKVKEICGDKILKVILETCYLTDNQIVQACKLAKIAGADFVKTSTGFGTGGAKIGHIRLMHKTVGNELGIKASGGIRDAKTAIAMINAGATRIGASAGIKIVEGLKRINE